MRTREEEREADLEDVRDVGRLRAPGAPSRDGPPSIDQCARFLNDVSEGE